MLISRKIRLCGILFFVIVCVGFGIVSYIKLSIVQQSENASLYALVPVSALAVADTDDAGRVARLFTGLKPSGNENKVLVSFHETNQTWEQVLYCGRHDAENGDTPALPSRSAYYKGEKIHIYPMPDGRFLASCHISGNMALSYSKRLIEEVIDTHHAQTSLLSDTSFTGVLENKRQSSIPATVYARLKLWGWTQFDMQLSDSTILFSGAICRTASVHLPDSGYSELTAEVREMLSRLIRVEHKTVPVEVILTSGAD